MKSFSSILITAIVFGACAPAQTVGTAPSVPASSPPPAAEPAARLTTVPDNWWLLDPSADRVFGTSAERAYRELLADRPPSRTVVVAILDSGIDIEHEDLDDNLWVNQDEIAGNGVDDDRNGYTDDIHGWNFIGGPDGQHVHHDSYEVTRLFVQCRDRGELTTVPCAAIAADFEAQRAEATEYLEQYQSLTTALAQFTAILQAHLGVDALDRARVDAIRPDRVDLAQARQAYLQLTDAGVTPEVLADGIEALTNQVEYGLNPAFDPRSIVGDDYDDPTERVYGNADVEGPAAMHGTHVAGIVGAERGNGTGIDGIARGVQLMVIRTVPDGDERDKDIANAIRYAVDNGADIINMSFGKRYSPGKAVVDEAVRYADSQGVLMVHAAGNDGANVDEDDNFPNRFFLDGGEARLWIEVGASGWQSPDSLAAPFSNYGQEKVDVFAPGVAILSTIPDGGYELNQGTSMAAPVVSGLAALLMAHFPELSAEQVREIILETAIPHASQSVLLPGGGGGRSPFGALSVTGGIVNAYAAVRRAAELSGPPGR